MKIAGALGCDEQNIIFPFSLCSGEMRSIEAIKRDLKDYAVIVPGARWDTKIWAAGNFGRIASLLPLKSIVIGSKSDMEIAQEVVQASAGKAISMAGCTSLSELIELMRHAKVVISNDSGPMHIAAGFDVPVVAIFGPTSPVRTGPYGKGHIIIKSDLECAPCFKKKCGDVKCMRGITAEQVYERIKNSLIK
jgi:lipopolysaccharide heptosyltransferase II